MPSKPSQCCIEEEKRKRDVNQKMLDEKMIALVHVCPCCGRKFPFKRSRKSCPICQGLLRTKTTILKIP
jgi:rubrerythrin